MSAAVQPALLDARLLPLGDAALTVEFGSVIAPQIHARVLGFASALEDLAASGRIAGVLEWVPTFRSVTVYFDPDRIAGETLATELLALARTSASLTVAGAHWRIPVCFEPEFAPDLDELAAAKSMPREAVVELMTQTVFSVYMLGFQPGFSYMGGLPEALEMPRLASPRKRVPAGSVAVAQRMCAAYPWESPGGWRLLGRTPVPLFDAADAERPALLAPGDQVRWHAVDRGAYEALQARCAAGTFERASLRMAAAPGEVLS
ncbi:MAG: 5-oxoprolinase subunit PxpB [Polaromonas sp.]